MYFEDGHVEEGYNDRKFIHVGWLDVGKPYTKGKCPPEFIEKLKKQNPAIRTKGFHVCPFCGNSSSSTQFQFLIEGQTYYDIPDMIIHYVEEHEYLPPQELIDLVLGLEDEEPFKFNRRR